MSAHTNLHLVDVAHWPPRGAGIRRDEFGAAPATRIRWAPRSIVQLLSALTVVAALVGTPPVFGGGYSWTTWTTLFAYSWAEAGSYRASVADGDNWGHYVGAYAYAASGSDWGESSHWARRTSTGGWATHGGNGRAGPENPFDDAVIVPGVDGWAGAEIHGELADGVLTLTGSMGYTVNGFVEVAVLDARGLRAPPRVTTGYSVQAALTSGALQPSRVLGHWREAELALELAPIGPSSAISSLPFPEDLPMSASGTFVRRVSVRGLKKEDIALSVVVHSAGSENLGDPIDLDVDKKSGVQEGGFVEECRRCEAPVQSRRGRRSQN